MEDLDIYTGFTNFNGVDFLFVFDKKELKLNPLDNKEDEVTMWFIEGKNFYFDCSYIKGFNLETKRNFIFIPSFNRITKVSNSILYISIDAYIVIKDNEQKFSRIDFESPELNLIYPVNDAIKVSKLLNKGNLCFITKKFEDTITKKQVFVVDGKNITVQFKIYRAINSSKFKTQIILNSNMTFEFEPTNDFIFIYRLWKVAKKFIQYLCYRKDVHLPSAKLTSIDESGNSTEGYFYILGESVELDIETLKHRKHIELSFLEGNEGKILNDIANNKIYLHHLPENYYDKVFINDGRFIIIVSAFEWEFNRQYPEGIKKSESAIKIKKEVEEAIDKLIKASTRKTKDKFKYLKNRIKDTSLQQKIQETTKKYENIIYCLCKNLYSRNNKDFTFSEIGKRLGDQRNNFAHGKLDKEFNSLCGLDLRCLEYIIYAMQLKYYGVSDLGIQKIIKSLFN